MQKPVDEKDKMAKCAAKIKDILDNETLSKQQLEILSKQKQRSRQYHALRSTHTSSSMSKSQSFEKMLKVPLVVA